MHELFTTKITQHGTIAAHSLCNQERRTVAGMEQRCGMELYELHVLNSTLGTVHHGNTIACGYKGIGSCGIYSSHTSGRHQCDSRQKFVDATRIGIQHIGAIASDTWSAPRHYLSEMVLRDYLYSKMIFVNIDIWILTYTLDKTLLNLKAGIVGMVQYPEFRMPAFTMQIKITVGIAVEVHSPFQKLTYLLRGFGNHFAHCLWVAQTVTGYHRILDMLVEIINGKISHRGYTTLCKCRIGFIKSGFTH